MSTPLCPRCKEMQRTHRSVDGPCPSRDAGYNNCFDRRQCEKMETESPSQILLGIIQSGCLSCNHTTKGRQIVERRLREIAKGI